MAQRPVLPGASGSFLFDTRTLPYSRKIKRSMRNSTCDAAVAKHGLVVFVQCYHQFSRSE